MSDSTETGRAVQGNMIPFWMLVFNMYIYLIYASRIRLNTTKEIS